MNIQRQLERALLAALSGRPATVPESGRLAWGWFLDLCRTRSSNGYGPNPISHAEIDAYSRLYRWPLEPRHIDMILAMDRVWLDHMRGSPKNGAGAAAKGQIMTPDSFDAVFG